ncbi:hypothetical protein OAO19_02945, partial [Gammaproteobacteria bacterium]|nr:hypothetical protein [Gammaproteobacteria bacterium]
TMSSDSATQLATQQSIKAYVDSKTAALNTKVVDIGDWDMDANASITVNHGVDYTKIRTITAVIREDSDSQYYDYYYDFNQRTSAHGLRAEATTITLYRLTGGFFDGLSFNATSYNRGWVTIQYTD